MVVLLEETDVDQSKLSEFVSKVLDEFANFVSMSCQKCFPRPVVDH